MPASGTRVVRSYGLYASTKRDMLAVCRGHVGARAGGSVRSAGLADGLQPAECGASGTLSRVWSTAGLPRHDSTSADFTTHACARGGRGMSHQQGVGPGRLSEGSALTPCPSWPRNTQGSSAGLERTLSSPPHRLSDALSSDRSVLSRIWGWYKFHRQGVRDSMRRSSNQALKLQRVARGCISVSVPLAQGLRKSSDFLMCTQGKS